MPKCPYCEEHITLKNTVRDEHDKVLKEMEGAVKKETMYSCPHCDRVLGFAFFFGGLLTPRP